MIRIGLFKQYPFWAWILKSNSTTFLSMRHDFFTDAIKEGVPKKLEVYFWFRSKIFQNFPKWAHFANFGTSNVFFSIACVKKPWRLLKNLLSNLKNVMPIFQNAYFEIRPFLWCLDFFDRKNHVLWNFKLKITENTV